MTSGELIGDFWGLLICKSPDPEHLENSCFSTQEWTWESLSGRWLCVCVVYARTCIHVCMCMCVCMCIRMYMYMCVCMPGVWVADRDLLWE